VADLDDEHHVGSDFDGGLLWTNFSGASHRKFSASFLLPMYVWPDPSNDPATQTLYDYLEERCEWGVSRDPE
jgi:hypothetical protein